MELAVRSTRSVDERLLVHDGGDGSGDGDGDE
jgi:hypothetical protein